MSGNAPVKVLGKVKENDFLVPSGKNDGCAIVRPPGPSQIPFARALENSKNVIIFTIFRDF